MFKEQTLEEQVNTPNHYRTHESGIEAIEITRWLPNDLGNAWKYGMRYEDKNTPKKDLLKLVWYLTDYRNEFIDDNNCVTNEFTVPSRIIKLMAKVIATEPCDEVKRVFGSILAITLDQGLVNPEGFAESVAGIEKLAEKFSV